LKHKECSLDLFQQNVIVYISKKWSLLVLDSLFEVLNSDGRLQIGALGLTWLLAFISGGFFLPILGLRTMSFVQSLITRFISLKERLAYQKVVKPYENWLGVAFCLLLADIFAILLPESDWSRLIEIPIGLALTITAVG
jgi:MscS family membrane protein